MFKRACALVANEGLAANVRPKFFVPKSCLMAYTAAPRSTLTDDRTGNRCIHFCAPETHRAVKWRVSDEAHR